MAKFVETAPNWSNSSNLTGEEFASVYRRSVYFYSTSKSPNQLKRALVKWMQTKSYSANQIASIQSSSQLMITTGAVASALLDGMPACHPNFNAGKDIEVWLHNQIFKFIPFTEQTISFGTEFDRQIDEWIATNGNYDFDYKPFKDLKPTVADSQELLKLANEIDQIPDCEQLTEAYAKYRNIDKLKEFLMSFR